MDILSQVFWMRQEVFIMRYSCRFSLLFHRLIGLIALFILSFRRQHYRLWHVGKDEDCSGNWALRIKTVFAVALANIRIWRETYPGTMHFLILWGTLLIFAGKIIRLFAYPVGLSVPPQALFLYASFVSEIGESL